MTECQSDPDLEIQVLVTGMHLSREHGHTFEQIEKDGFQLTARIETQLASDTNIGMAKAMGLGLMSFAEELSRLKPDAMVVLGDRYEIFAAAQAAYVLRIPIVHIHGGEQTVGALDEGFRHGMTKLAHFHITTAETYRKRVIQMGEHPDRVVNAGAPGVENIRRLSLLDRPALEKELGMPLASPFFLVTFHPTTLDPEQDRVAIESTLAALEGIAGANIVFTQSNSDPGHSGIRERLDAFVKRRPESRKMFTSLGQLRYLSAMKHADVVVGNSSSGILEAPSFGKSTVNIGDRQDGRVFAESVFSCTPTAEGVSRALAEALEAARSGRFKAMKSPYGEGHFAEPAKAAIKTWMRTRIEPKKFWDLA
jgi:UDP-N-acetylglucosamine 2-epimerase (non-hydrolysing)/GDP/UDP-N,N'-diacetylbacillosamine 2-epimerase (hydrolysing)